MAADLVMDAREERSKEPSPSRGSGRATAGWLLAAGLGLVGLAFHAWYVFHVPLTSDQAVPGLIADDILHGHFSAFYWGQHYGGTGEEFVMAVLVGVFGSSAFTVGGTAVLLSAIAAVLTWRIGIRLMGSRWCAAAAGLIVWLTPQSGIANASTTYGFRELTLVCGLLMLLLILQLDDRLLPGTRPWKLAGHVVLLGLIAGVGWWSSPEIVYFLGPAGGLLVAQLIRHRHGIRPRRVATYSGLCALGALVGAIPWLWSNVHPFLQSLNTKAFPTPLNAPDYAVRLHRFFRYSLPMLFSLREDITGRWLGGQFGHLLFLLLMAVLIVSIVIAATFGGLRGLSVAIGVVGFPFLLAISPASWYWQDGRYVIFVVPFIALAFAIAADQVGRRWPSIRTRLHRKRQGGREFAPIALIAPVLALCLATSFANFAVFVAPSAGTAWWMSPDQPTLSGIRTLEEHGITLGYANYWVAYRVDFLSGGRLTLTSVDPDRQPALTSRINASPSAAWIFVAPTPAALAQFGSTLRIRGPDGIAEGAFLSFLATEGVPFRLIHAGMMDAVIPAQALPRWTMAYLAGS